MMRWLISMDSVNIVPFINVPEDVLVKRLSGDGHVGQKVMSFMNFTMLLLKMEFVILMDQSFIKGKTIKKRR